MFAIEESIEVRADALTTWKTMTDVTCWADWNTVLRDAEVEEGDALSEGRTVSCRLNVYAFPLGIRPRASELVEGKKLVWTGSKFGVFARHEYLFEEVRPGRTRVTSREEFSGPLFLPVRPFFPEGRIRKLTVTLLQELKAEAERRASEKS